MIRSAALTLVALLSWLSASPARAQVLPRVHYIASYTDNLFRSHDPAAAWVTNEAKVGDRVQLRVGGEFVYAQPEPEPEPEPDGEQGAAGSPRLVVVRAAAPLL